MSAYSTRQGGCHRAGVAVRSISAFTSALWFSLAALAAGQDSHDRHVVFDNSAADRSYYYSSASLVAPSELEIADVKVPVESSQFVSPPNCLRLKWKSAPGGDWRVTLKVPERYARSFAFSGDTLSLWCYSTEELEPERGPWVFVQDSSGRGVPTIPLLSDFGPLPAGR